jgi:hypothetical protein
MHARLTMGPNAMTWFLGTDGEEATLRRLRYPSEIARATRTLELFKKLGSNLAHQKHTFC